MKRRTLLGSLLALFAACGPGPVAEPSTAEPSSAPPVATDTSREPGPCPAGHRRSIACGGTPRAPDETCPPGTHPGRNGVGGYVCAEARCVPIPAECGSNPTCECVGPDACSVGGCFEVTETDIVCLCG